MAIELNAENMIENSLSFAFGIDTYLYIINGAKNWDPSEEASYRKTFNGYYKVMRKSTSWYNKYYSLMKDKNTNFNDVLIKMYSVNNTVEVSFTSKLIATIDPNMPIWDRYVLENLGLSKEWEKYREKDSKERIEKANEIYEKIIASYNEFLKSDEGKACIRKFDEALPNYKDKITDVKKIDFFLWSKR